MLDYQGAKIGSMIKIKYRNIAKGSLCLFADKSGSALNAVAEPLYTNGGGGEPSVRLTSRDTRFFKHFSYI